MSEAGREEGRVERPMFTGEDRKPEPRAWKPFAAAGGAVILAIVVLLIVFRPGSERTNPGDTAYAASLAISNVRMSDSSNLSGGKETYLDGSVTNNGKKTVTGITVRLDFKDSNGAPTPSADLTLNLIRARQPYVDIEPVNADPIRPGQSRPFRLIFDAPPDTWNGAYPRVQVISARVE